MWLQRAEQKAPPSPDGGDLVIPSPPQPLLVATQTFQQEMSSSSRLSQGLRVWAPPFPCIFQGPAQGLRATLRNA